MSLPALSLVPVPGRRRQTVALARQAEARGFAGIFTPSMFGAMPLSGALATATERMLFGPAIAPIYARAPLDLAQSAAFLHELSDGRFRLGLGVAHAPSHQRMGVVAGRPLADMREYVARLRAVEGVGPLPPIVLAALRPRMVALAGEIAEGVVLANTLRDHMPTALAALPPARRSDPGFFIGAMIPTCVSADRAAARAVHRRTLTRYAGLPNYRNYWREAGFAAEMAAIETALAEGREAEVPALLTDRWIDQITLSGPAEAIRDGVAAWVAAGVATPILVPSSVSGGQFQAVAEIFAAFDA
ncbi:MAG: LLM class flavin-dependent oxidoreductase [Acetobacteraceae bacterium]